MPEGALIIFIICDAYLYSAGRQAFILQVTE